MYMVSECLKIKVKNLEDCKRCKANIIKVLLRIKKEKENDQQPHPL